MRYPGIPIAAEVPDGLICMADGPRLGSVVRELLDNACRYSPFGRAVELVARDLRRGRDRDGDRPGRRTRSRGRHQSLRTALLHRRGRPPQGEVRRRHRPASGSSAGRRARRGHVGRPAPGRRHARVLLHPPAARSSGSSRRPPAPPDLLVSSAVSAPPLDLRRAGEVSCPRGSGAGAQKKSSSGSVAVVSDVRMHPRVLGRPHPSTELLITPSPTAVQPRHRRPGPGRRPGPVARRPGRSRAPGSGVASSPRRGTGSGPTSTGARSACPRRGSTPPGSAFPPTSTTWLRTALCLSRLTTSANCREQSRQVYLDRRPTFDVDRLLAGTLHGRGSRGVQAGRSRDALRLLRRRTGIRSRARDGHPEQRPLRGGRRRPRRARRPATS